MKTELIFFDNYENSMQGTYRGLIAFISLIVLDFIYFNFTKDLYYLGNNISKTDVNIYSALLSWLLLASAISVQLPKNFNESILYGALVGLVVYGIFNLVNYSMLKQWSISIVLMDTIWGVFNCSFAAGLIYLLYWNNKQK